MRTTILYPNTSYLEGRAPRARGRRRVDVCGIAEPFHLLRDLSCRNGSALQLRKMKYLRHIDFARTLPKSGSDAQRAAPEVGTRRSVSVQRALGRCRFVDIQPFFSKSLPRTWPVYAATVFAARPTRRGEAVGPNTPPALTFYIILPVGIRSRENHVPEARNLSFWLGCPSEVAIVTIKAFGKNLHGK